LQKWSKGKQKEKANNMVLFDQVGLSPSRRDVWLAPYSFAGRMATCGSTFSTLNEGFLRLQATYDKLKSEVPKYKMITTSILSDRLKV
jgi:small subunit ribosomal protein S25e